MTPRTKKATFAAGCFWGVEEDLRSVAGVIDARVGYTGGHVPKPSYEIVCYTDSGHAESVEIDFDPEVVSYDDLLDRFFELHDPTQLNRQGPDVGEQYRSAIFVHDDEQEAAAKKAVERAQAKRPKPIATKIERATDFWEAEDYHQQFFAKKGIRRH